MRKCPVAYPFVVASALRSALYRRAAVMLKACSLLQKYLLIAAVCLFCFAMSGCVESSFELASQSRLPAWISLPAGLTRADVSVTANYYTLGNVKFQLRDKTGKSLAEVIGKVINNDPLELPGCRQKTDSRCPAFEVVIAKGTTEIMEYKNGKLVFYVNDDPTIRGLMLLSVGRMDKRPPTRRDPLRAWRYGQLRPH